MLAIPQVEGCDLFADALVDGVDSLDASEQLVAV
jgi:hypothetical protein